MSDSEQARIINLELKINDLLAERDSALAQNLEQLNNCIAALQIANKRIDKLEKYNLDLANESHNKSDMIDYERSKNAELVAQVEATKSAYQNLCGAISDMDDCESDTDEMETAIGAVFHAMRNGYNSFYATPTQCLRDIQAEAGRAGYAECALDYGLASTCESREQVVKNADQYAERVKAGEA